MDIDLPFRGSRFIAACSKPIQTNVDKYIDISVTPDQHHRQNIKRCCVSLTEWSDTGTQVRPPAPWDRGVSSRMLSYVSCACRVSMCVCLCRPTFPSSIAPARPDGAGTGGAKKTKHYAVAKGFCMGLFESWQACEDAVKGFKGAKFKSFISRDEAIFFLEENGVLVGDKTDRITARTQGARINTATSFRILTLQSARTTQSARDTL